MPLFEKGPRNPRYRSSLHPAGTEGALDGSTPSTPKEIEVAERERTELATLAGQKPAELPGQAPADAPPVRYAEYALPPSPTPPAVDPQPILDRAAQLKVQIDETVRAIAKATADLEHQKAVERAALEKCRQQQAALVSTKESLERAVGQAQSELATLEARELARQAVEDQKARQVSERLPLDEWRAKFRDQIRPMIQRVQQGHAKLKALLKDKGQDLEFVSALRCPPGLPEGLHREYQTVSIEAGKLFEDIHRAIKAHEKVIARAEDFVAWPNSPDGRSEINALRWELERCSGIITARLVDIPHPDPDLRPRPGTEGHTPLSIDCAQRASSLLKQYANVQTRVNAILPAPPALVAQTERPRHEVMAIARGPQERPEQTHAAGSPEGV
jgi:hypothetical protein